MSNAILDQRTRSRPRYVHAAVVTLPFVGPYCYLFYYQHVSGRAFTEVRDYPDDHDTEDDSTA